ncbi:MAG: high-potential iron-sulfur protein [Xanthobacteraceae bacterium]
MALTSTALAFAAAADAAITRAGAQQKLSQAAAKYQGQPKGKQSCAVCANFQPPNACRFVQGVISPNGWCQLFAAKT